MVVCWGVVDEIDHGIGKATCTIFDLSIGGLLKVKNGNTAGGTLCRIGHSRSVDFRLRRAGMRQRAACEVWFER